MIAQVLEEGGHRAGLQASRILDAVQEVADYACRQTSAKQQPDMPDPADCGFLEEPLPGRGPVRCKETLIFVVAEEPCTHACA